MREYTAGCMACTRWTASDGERHSPYSGAAGSELLVEAGVQQPQAKVSRAVNGTESFAYGCDGKLPLCVHYRT